MHPVIRILTFLVIAAFLAYGGATLLLSAALTLAICYALTVPHAWRAPFALLRRLRWLLLSLLVIYGWFTPGVTLVSGWGDAAPTVEGLTEGLQRGAALLLMAAAAQLLMLTTERAQLLAAIHWLLRPLRVLGIPHERLVLRLTLTLDAVPRLQTLLGPSLYAGLTGNPLNRLGQLAARAFQGALDQAGRQPCTALDIPANGAPPWHQWLYPFALGIVLGLI